MPDVALDTPLAQINLALEGKFDFLRKTNPWRTEEDVEADRLAEMQPDPGGVAAAFQAMVRRARPLPPRPKKIDGADDG